MATHEARFLLIVSNCPDPGVADRVARALVEEGLAACINILPPMRSVYLWEGEVESAEEYLLLIKARASDYDAVERRICALHPYDVPEVIAVPITAGLAAYLAWVDDPDGTGSDAG